MTASLDVSRQMLHSNVLSWVLLLLSPAVCPLPADELSLDDDADAAAAADDDDDAALAILCLQLHNLEK